MQHAVYFIMLLLLVFPLKPGVVLHLNKLELNLLKGALCKVLLKFARCL